MAPYFKDHPPIQIFVIIRYGDARWSLKNHEKNQPCLVENLQ